MMQGCPRDGQSGFTLIELLAVAALSVAALTAVAAYAVPMVAREAAVSAGYSVQQHMQYARVEAVSRNRQCRFVVDTGTGVLAVFDSMATGSTGDDVLLYETTLPATVSFAHPGFGSPVTLTSLGGTAFGAVFDADGSVNSGWGQVILFGGDTHRRISLFAGGGVGMERWNGSGWIAGS